MTHIMVGDGVLPWWLSGAGILAAVVLVTIASRQVTRTGSRRAIPATGVMTALMVVVMSIEIVPIGYELHGTVLAGIILGPWFGAISSLLFNVVRAFLGDGAITNIGLNTVVTWLEMAVGSMVFSRLRPFAYRGRASLCGGIATAVSLSLSTLVFLAIIALSGVEPASAVHTGSFDVATGTFDPEIHSGGLVEFHLPGSGEHPEATVAGLTPFTWFAFATLFLGALGWAIEGLVTGVTVGFIARIRPGLIGLSAGSDGRGRPTE